LRLFSERKGITPVKVKLQIDTMDDDLRNGLWTALVVNFFGTINRQTYVHDHAAVRDLLGSIWLGFFKRAIDTLADWGPKVYNEIRQWFFNCYWYEVYNFIEYVARNYSDHYGPEGSTESKKKAFVDDCNAVLETEVSAYRFVGVTIAQLTSKQEIAAIEEALKTTDALEPVQRHLETALALLSRKKAPDYKNSVKESISAVESLGKLITGDKNATLSDALALIEKQGKVKLHPALKGAFDKLYGYTSSAGGIRHGTIDDTEIDFDIAKFMLVACSAFVNYLISSANNSGIKL